MVVRGLTNEPELLLDPLAAAHARARPRPSASRRPPTCASVPPRSRRRSRANDAWTRWCAAGRLVVEVRGHGGAELVHGRLVRAWPAGPSSPAVVARARRHVRLDHARGPRARPPGSEALADELQCVAGWLDEQRANACASSTATRGWPAGYRSCRRSTPRAEDRRETRRRNLGSLWPMRQLVDLVLAFFVTWVAIVTARRRGAAVAPPAPQPGQPGDAQPRPDPCGCWSPRQPARLHRRLRHGGRPRSTSHRAGAARTCRRSPSTTCAASSSTRPSSCDQHLVAAARHPEGAAALVAAAARGQVSEVERLSIRLLAHDAGATAARPRDGTSRPSRPRSGRISQQLDLLDRAHGGAHRDRTGRRLGRRRPLLAPTGNRWRRRSRCRRTSCRLRRPRRSTPR